MTNSRRPILRTEGNLDMSKISPICQKCRHVSVLLDYPCSFCTKYFNKNRGEWSGTMFELKKMVELSDVAQTSILKRSVP